MILKIGFTGNFFFKNEQEADFYVYISSPLEAGCIDSIAILSKVLGMIVHLAWLVELCWKTNATDIFLWPVKRNIFLKISVHKRANSISSCFLKSCTHFSPIEPHKIHKKVLYIHISDF